MNDVILNIAGGKFPPLGLDKLTSYFLVNVDTMYYQHMAPGAVERALREWGGLASNTYNINSDIFNFLERTTMEFDKITIYRFLEHISMDRVLYFIYLLSTVTKPGNEIDVIVPNYNTLAHMILSEEANIANDVIDFEANNILLTTELLNEPSCPHASIWTEYRAHRFFGLEGRFKIKDVDEKFEYDGRDIYLRFKAERV